jgi:hypothetical protein
VPQYLKLGLTLVISMLLVNYVALQWSSAKYEDHYQDAVKKQETYVKQHEEAMQARIQIQDNSVQEAYNNQIKKIQQDTNWQDNKYQNTWQDNSRSRELARITKNKERELSNEKRQQEIKKRNRSREISAENLRSVRAKNDQTCQFWLAEYKKDNSYTNKKHLSNACDRAAKDGY